MLTKLIPHQLIAKPIPLLVLGFICHMLVACDQQQPITTTEQPITSPKIYPPTDPVLLEALTHYQSSQIHALTNTISCVKKLSERINIDFLPEPNEKVLIASQKNAEHCLAIYLHVHTILSTHTLTQKFAN